MAVGGTAVLASSRDTEALLLGSLALVGSALDGDGAESQQRANGSRQQN